METAGDLVALATELAAGVQHREHHLGGALALVWARRVRIDRETATVIVDAAAAIGQQRDVDPRGEARHRLVDRVVDDLPDEGVQTGQTGGPDVHARAFPDGVETLQHLDVFGAVTSAGLIGVGRHAHLDRFGGKQALTCWFLGDT